MDWDTKDISMNQLSHIDGTNNPQMVDVGDKAITHRLATAQSSVLLPKNILDLLNDGEIISKKGPVFHTAILAGTMGAKRTSELIPLCHNIPLDSCKIEINIKGKRVIIKCTAKCCGRTGVEMEALTGASIAALTIYDMCKALSHNIIIEETKLVKKSGGKSDFSSCEL